jgi:hypothetical protein
MESRLPFSGAPALNNARKKDKMERGESRMTPAITAFPVGPGMRGYSISKDRWADPIFIPSSSYASIDQI